MYLAQKEYSTLNDDTDIFVLFKPEREDNFIALWEHMIILKKKKPISNINID